MKYKILAFLLLLTIMSQKTHAAKFDDVPRSHKQFVAISQLSEDNILNGYKDGTFKPDKTVNRVEALKVILEGANIKNEEETSENIFSDVPGNLWYSKYVSKAKKMGIIKGNPNGSFAPDRKVKKAEFMKMLLEANHFMKEKWNKQKMFNDVAQDIWYAAYMNYAGKAGLIIPDKNKNLYPDKELTRAEVAEILYLMRIILRGKDTQYLISQSEQEMAQIEIYIGVKDISSAKRASELAYDFTQQALSLAPENKVVLGAAKIAKAYTLLIDTYIAGVQKKVEEAKKLAKATKIKATEAWEANKDIQKIAKHIKDRADEILKQL